MMLLGQMTVPDLAATAGPVDMFRRRYNLTAESK